MSYLRPGLQAEQTKWEEEILSLLPSTEPADFAWVDDAQSNGGRTEGTWKFVGKNEGPVFSKERSRVQTAAPEQGACAARIPWCKSENYTG